MTRPPLPLAFPVSALTLGGVCLALLLVGVASRAGAQDYDLAFRGATLYLGGDALVPGDLAVRGERIAAVGAAPGRATREIDATGLVVAPGFIDLHTHTDEIYRMAGGWPLPRALHENRNYWTQGVTTIVTGNCGSGFASPEDIAAWLERVDDLPYGTNVAHLVPHGQLRREILGEAQLEREDPHPSPDELARMKDAVDAGMRAGAWGLATGLIYDPGARAGTAELVALSRVVARHGGLYVSHTRHEGPDPVRTYASYAEAIAIGEQAGVPTHISHIKLAGRGVHGRTAEIIGLVEAARARGLRVTADAYPYAASSTALAVLAPSEMRDGMRVHPRFCEEGPRRDALRAGIARSLAEETPPQGVVISVYPWRWWWQGRTLAQLAADRERAPVEVAADLVCGRPGLGIYHGQHEEDVRQFMRQPWVATASDGAAAHDWIGRYVHPRAYGTFPRKIRRYALEEGWIELAFALRSMTELPAEILGLRDRGRLAAGSFADVVAFDPARIRDVATYERSGRHSEGVAFLLVNGVLAIDAGEITGERAGRALRHRSPAGRADARHPRS